MKTKKIVSVILVSIALLLMSCSSNISGLRDMDSPYIIVNASDWASSKTHCLYTLSTRVSYVGYQNDVDIIDSIGKFSIGDTVYVAIEKKHNAPKKIK